MGRAVFGVLVASVVAYLAAVGLDKADKTASSGIQVDGGGWSAQVACSGDATAEGPGSVANTGIMRSWPS
jgi:hypothetical protein